MGRKQITKNTQIASLTVKKKYCNSSQGARNHYWLIDGRITVEKRRDTLTFEKQHFGYLIQLLDVSIDADLSYVDNP